MKKKRPYKQVVLPSIFRFSQEIENKLQLIPHQELDALRRGVGSEESFHTLAARLNVGLVCVQRHWPENVAANESMNAALQALVSMQHRFVDSQKWGMSGDEFKAMGLGLNLTDEAQLNLTRRQFGDALEYVIKVASI